MSMTKRSVVFLAALAMIATLVPLTSQAKKQAGKVIQPIPAVQDFSKAEMKQLNEQWAGKVYDYVPPRGGVKVLSQPDGSTFDAMLTGAEIGGRFETVATGHTVVQNSGGWWTYALKSKKQAGQVVPSKKIVGRGAPAGIPARIGRIDPIWTDQATGADIRTQLFEYFRSESVAATQAAQAAGEVRKLKIPMLLLETQGEFQPGSMPEPTEDFLNGYGKEKPTVTEFYMEMSWGQLLAEVDVYGPYKSIPSQVDPCHYGGITVAGNSNYASPHNQLTGGFGLGIGGGGVAGMAVEAVPQADVEVDFSEYDNDDDGYVDLVFIAHSGSDMAVTGDPCDTWSHAISLEPVTEPISPVPLGIPTSDGVVVSNFNTVAELGIPVGGMEVGVVSHEATHNLGEPDFYDTSYQSQGTGDWDNMAGGSHFGDPPGTNPLHPNPLVKLSQAWVEPQVITKTTKNIRLRPWEVYKDLVMVPLRYGDDPSTTPIETDAIVEAHLIHYSSRSAHGPRNWGSPIDGPDKPAIYDRLLLNSGLIVWHWDDSIGSNNDSTRYRLDMEEFDRLDKTQELALNRTRGEPTDPYFDTATGLSGATRVGKVEVVGEPLTFAGTALPVGAAYGGAPPAYTFEFTVPAGPKKVSDISVKETCLEAGGDWDLYVDQLIDGSWEEVTSGATGACSESALVQGPTIGGQYRARVVNYLATDFQGGFTGEVIFKAGGEENPIYKRPDTYDNEGNATGFTIGNVRPLADGMQISAEVLGPQFMTFDVIKDKRADVSPGFLVSDDAILAGRKATLKTEVFNNGGTAARNVVATVSEGGTVIATKTIASLAASTAADISFPWTPSGEGRHVLKLAVSTASVESSSENNAQNTELAVYSSRALGGVLIVDDDDGYDSQETFEGALATLGIPYAVTHAHPSAAELKRYRAVIWEAGVSRMKGQLTTEDIAELKKYLDGGGRVWFSSPRLSAGLTAAEDTVTGQLNPGADPGFGANYLGLGYKDSQSRGGGIAVPTKDAISKVSYAFKPFPGRTIQDLPKAVGSAFGTVTQILDWKRGDATVATIGLVVHGNAEHKNFRTVFTGFNAASLVTPESVIDLVSSVMKTLGVPTGTRRPTEAVLYHASPVYSLRGESQVISAVVTGTTVGNVTLLYRPYGTKEMKVIPMSQRAAGVYEATLDGKLFQPPGIEYRIVAQTADGALSAPAAKGFGYFVSVPNGHAKPELPYSLASVLGARFTPTGVAPASGGGGGGGGAALPATGVGSGMFGLVLVGAAVTASFWMRRRRFT
jgi:M6 family metalloprotease-like protein